MMITKKKSSMITKNYRKFASGLIPQACRVQIAHNAFQGHCWIVGCEGASQIRDDNASSVCIRAGC